MPPATVARPTSRPRNRSVRAARARATLHMQHTQGLSRSPQTVPTNTEAADQTCWSAACAYARRREKRLYLVAGVQDQHAPSGLIPDEAASQSPALCSRLGAALLNVSGRHRESRQIRHHWSTFGFYTRRQLWAGRHGRPEQVGLSPERQKGHSRPNLLDGLGPRMVYESVDQTAPCSPNQSREPLNAARNIQATVLRPPTVTVTGGAALEPTVADTA